MYLFSLLMGCVTGNDLNDALEQARQEGYQEAVADFEERLSAVENATGDVGTNGDLQSQVTNLQTTVSTLATQAELKAVEDRVKTLEDKVDALDGRVTTLEGQALDGRVTTLEGEAGLMETDLVAHQTRLDDLDTQMGEVDGRVSTLEAGLSKTESDLATLDGGVTLLETDFAALEDIAVTMIEKDTTYNVATPTELLQTLEDLDRVRIASSATVTIQLADGTYNMTDTVQIRHPDGDRIRIQGNTGDKSLVELVYAGAAGSDAVQVVAGSTLAYLGDFTLTCSSDSDGLVVDPNGWVELGPLKIDSCHDGISSLGGSINAAEGAATALGWLEVVNSTDDGIFAENAWIDLPYSTVRNCADTAFAADLGSVFVLHYSLASGAGGAGFQSSNSTINANYATAENGGSIGYYTTFFGAMATTGSTSTGNTNGYVAERSSHIVAGGSTSTGSAGYDYYTISNSFIEATSYHGKFRTTTVNNDTTDWIFP